MKISISVSKVFKNSKVVDENGNLLVVYHGSASGKFDKFEVEKISDSSMMSAQGPGFYFTDEKNARQYLKKSNEHGAGQVAVKGAHLFSVYLNITKPLYITQRSDTLKDVAAKLYEHGDNKWFFSNWVPFDMKGVTVNGIKLEKADIEAMSNKEKAELYANHQSTDCAILSNLVRAYKDKALMLSTLKRITKNDGVIFSDSYGKIYVAWSPKQIKIL